MKYRGKCNLFVLCLCSISLLSVTGLISSCSFEESNANQNSAEQSQKTSAVDSNYLIAEDGSKIKIHTSFGSYKTYESSDELANSSDLTVIGKPLANIDESISFVLGEESKKEKKTSKESVSYIVRDKTGHILDSYTITPFKVNKYVKGNLKDKTIEVLQPSALLREEGNNPIILQTEGSSPLNKKSKYLLFLKEVDTETYPNSKGVYSIISINQGKFNFDKTDERESKVESEDPQYRNLKENIKGKYGKIYDSTTADD
jgi:hypothetical protein